jgi:hypothetical protein
MIDLLDRMTDPGGNVFEHLREEWVIERVVAVGFRGLLLLPLKPNFDSVHGL